MLQWITVLAVNAALIASSGEGTPAYRGATADDRQAIASLHAREAAASKARDASGLAALWTDDVVSLRSGEAPVRGRRANEASLARTLLATGSAELLDSSIDLEEVVVAGDLAYEWGAYRARFRPAPGAEAIPQEVHVMRILARQPDGSWKIARAIYAPPTTQRRAKPGERLIGIDPTFADLAASMPRLFGGTVPCIEP